MTHAPARDPLLDSMIAHLRTAGEALIAATNAATAIRDRQTALAEHVEAREEQARTDAARKRADPPTLMKKPRDVKEAQDGKDPSTAEPAQENAA